MGCEEPLLRPFIQKCYRMMYSPRDGRNIYRTRQGWQLPVTGNYRQLKWEASDSLIWGNFLRPLSPTKKWLYFQWKPSQNSIKWTKRKRSQHTATHSCSCFGVSYANRHAFIFHPGDDTNHPRFWRIIPGFEVIPLSNWKGRNRGITVK